MTAPARINRRQRALLAYYANPHAGTLQALNVYRGQMTGTQQALRRRGLITDSDRHPFTALTPDGERALAAGRQEVPK
jgi:hypothetical protein